jgi:hypothetical protein
VAFAAGVYGSSQDSSVQASVDISISCHFCYFTLHSFTAASNCDLPRSQKPEAHPLRFTTSLEFFPPASLP